jgi:hypothetical protein
MSDATCKGDWSLGTACGTCQTCRDTALAAAVRFQDEARQRASLEVSEFSGRGLRVDGKLFNVAFAEDFDAEQYAKVIWKSGRLIEVVPVRVVKVTDVSFGAGLK